MIDTPPLIGRYVVDRRLGSGGMGEVFLAYSPAGDPVAVKLIRGDRLDPLTRARFEKEAQIARTVVGTNRVARFLDADPYADRPWLAMEYVAGATLAAHVEEHGPLPVALVASLGALLAEGLEAVHAVGLLHRDIKPQNVILGEYGPVLIDFGLGAFFDSAAPDTLTQSGMIIGTVRYIPPEQASGRRQVTPAADVYGLGAVLLFAATGHHPYEGGRWEAIVAQVADAQRPADLDGLPAPLIPLVAAMLAHEPTERPPLPEVTARCVALIGDQGASAIAARHALLDRAGSIERPLPRDPDPVSAPDMDVPDPPAIVEDPHEVPVGKRVSAAARVAGELRSRYAVSATL
jgi:serine/threonine protein kinase